VFPVGIGLRDPRSQKRDLGHPSISPFDIAEGTSFVISLPTRLSESAAPRDDKGRVDDRFSAAPTALGSSSGSISQPFRAGLTFGGRPSGPCFYGDLCRVISASTCRGKPAAPTARRGRRDDKGRVAGRSPNNLCWPRGAISSRLVNVPSCHRVAVCFGAE
jgi:hypothetical protein